MELLNWWAANVLLTSLAVSAIFSLVVCSAALVIQPSTRRIFWLLFFAAFSFAMLGFVTGELLGDSRESAVGSVVPAVLTLLAGIVSYVIGSKGLRSQSTISAALLCFTFAFLAGSLFGIGLRGEYEASLQDPQHLGARDLALERNNLAVEIQRLQDYVALLQLRNDYARKTNLDLSKFRSTFETPEETETKTEVRGAIAKTPPPTSAQEK